MIVDLGGTCHEMPMARVGFVTGMFLSGVIATRVGHVFLLVVSVCCVFFLACIKIPVNYWAKQ